MVAPLYVNRYLEEGGVKVIGFRVRQIPKTNRIINATNQLISSAIFKIFPPDILHETYYQRVSLAPKGCPVVVTVYDMIHEKFGAESKPLDQTSAAKRMAVTRADRVICISESTRRDLIDLFDVDP